MRPALIAVAIVLASLALPVGRAEAGGGDCNSKVGGVSCQETVSVSTPGRPASTGRRGAPDPDYVSFPWVVKAGDPGQCMTLDGTTASCSPSGLDLPAGTPDCIKGLGIGRAPELKGEARQQWQDSLAKYGMCPSNGTGAQAVDPVVFAIQAWQDVALPKPEPYIAPGWAITGKYAYLETRGELRRT